MKVRAGHDPLGRKTLKAASATLIVNECGSRFALHSSLDSDSFRTASAPADRTGDQFAVAKFGIKSHYRHRLLRRPPRIQNLPSARMLQIESIAFTPFESILPYQNSCSGRFRRACSQILAVVCHYHYPQLDTTAINGKKAFHAASDMPFFVMGRNYYA